MENSLQEKLARLTIIENQLKEAQAQAEAAKAALQNSEAARQREAEAARQREAEAAEAAEAAFQREVVARQKAEAAEAALQREAAARQREVEAAEAALQNSEAARQREAETAEAAFQREAAARQKAEAAFQREAAARQKIVIKKIFDEGLPECEMVLNSANTGATNEHQPVEFFVSNFSIVDNVTDFSNCDSYSKIMCSTASNCKLQFSSESDLQGFVKLVIQDMIEAAGLTKKIILLNEITFRRLRPDIWVLELGETSKIPIASVEVKREDKDLSNDRYLGQIFDYLLQLRQMHGRRDVFGIITNYFRWRIVWLPDCEMVACHPGEDISSVSMVVTDGRIMPRKLCGTMEISYNDLTLPCYLVSLIRKLSHSQSIPQGILHAEKAYIEISPSLYHWVSSTLTKLTLKVPHGNVSKFLLLRDFKYGGDGRVWLACSSSAGNLCVVKFLRESAREKGPAEAENWEKLYGVHTSSMTMVKDCPAVIMPFAFHCKVISGTRRFESCLSQGASSESYPDRNFLTEDVSAVNELDPEKIARQAIDTIVSRGYIHDDVKWDHVAALPTVQENGSVTFTGVLIDLTRVTKLDSEIDQDSARTQMLDSLGL